MLQRTPGVFAEGLCSLSKSKTTTISTSVSATDLQTAAMSGDPDFFFLSAHLSDLLIMKFI